jgi:multiphosphoryl transfer protein
MNDKELVLLAPVSGVIYPLERVPDPVFSQKPAGDGISIDPIDNPCVGEIVQQHGAGHAVTLKTAGEVEVLMQLGIAHVVYLLTGLNADQYAAKMRVNSSLRSLLNR